MHKSHKWIRLTYEYTTHMNTTHVWRTQAIRREFMCSIALNSCPTLIVSHVTHMNVTHIECVTHMNTSHTWIRHTYEGLRKCLQSFYAVLHWIRVWSLYGVMSHTWTWHTWMWHALNASLTWISCLTWINHEILREFWCSNLLGTEFVSGFYVQSCHTHECDTHEWDTHQMRHTHMNKSHTWINHGIPREFLCSNLLGTEFVSKGLLHKTILSHVTHIKAFVLSHVTHMNDMTQYMCDMTQYMCDITQYICDMTQYMCDMTQYMCIRVTWLNMTQYMCDMTQYEGLYIESCHTYEQKTDIWKNHTYEWVMAHQEGVGLVFTIPMCDKTHTYTWDDAFYSSETSSHSLDVPWLIHMCDMTHSYVWHNSFICVTWLILEFWNEFTLSGCAMTQFLWKSLLKLLHPRNPPNSKTHIPQYKFKWARGGEAHRAEAVAGYQGRSKWGGGNCLGPKFREESGAQLFCPRIDKPLDFFPHALRPALMVRDSGKPKAPPPPRAQPKSQFGFVPRDTEISEFLDLVDFGGVAISVETILCVTPSLVCLIHLCVSPSLVCVSFTCVCRLHLCVSHSFYSVLKKSYVWMSHGTHMNEKHTYEEVIRMNESWHT